MISEEAMKKNEADASLVLSNSKAYSAQIWDAARAIKELCESVRELQSHLSECQAVRDTWCAAYTELRDHPHGRAN